MDNYFEILGITPDSSDKEVKAKYRELIKKYHPDVNKDNEEYATEMTAKINEAYSVLATEEGRRNYQYLLSHENKVAKTGGYPASFVISDFSENGFASAEVFFADNAMALLYELVTGIDLQNFLSSLNADRTILFADFMNIYTSPTASENRQKSIQLIVDPQSAGDENMQRIYAYMRRLLAQSMRFYVQRGGDNIFRHIHWCEFMFCNQLTEESGKDILELEGMQRAEFKTFEFNFDDVMSSEIKHYKLKKTLFIIAAVIILIAVAAVVIFLLFNIFKVVIIAFAILAVVGFIYKLLNK
jgi:curved DNA-binding protein CbpA